MESQSGGGVEVPSSEGSKVHPEINFSLNNVPSLGGKPEQGILFLQNTTSNLGPNGSIFLIHQSPHSCPTPAPTQDNNPPVNIPPIIANKPNPKTLTKINMENEILPLPYRRLTFSNNLCRICLLEKDDGGTTNLFQNSIKGKVKVDTSIMQQYGKGVQHPFSILEAVKTLTGIEVNPLDGLPQQICDSCLDSILTFSVFRKTTFMNQMKLQQFLEQSKQGEENEELFIPSIGEKDFRNTNILKHAEFILLAKEALRTSKFSHLVRRSISDRVWDKMFQEMHSAYGRKSDKFKELRKYVLECPFVEGWMCTLCNTFVHGSCETYQIHHKTEHGLTDAKSLQYFCDICSSSRSMEDTMEPYWLHWLRHFFMFRCNICDERLPSPKALSCHNGSVHLLRKNRSQGDNPSDNEFNRLHEVHTEVGKFSCEICNIGFSGQTDLSRHKRSAHSKSSISKFDCELCGKSFKSKVSKNAHALKHKGEQPFGCGTCNQRFVTKTALKSHLLKHSTNRAFKCSEAQCNKSFKRKVYLHEHMKIHTGEKEFSCEICGKQIRMKSNFYKHIKIHKKREMDTKVQAEGELEVARISDEADMTN